MKLELTPFQKALNQLQKSLEYFNSSRAQQDNLLSVQFRAASIQAFEYSYELAIKMMRRQLAQIVANPQELSQLTFADLIRTAADAGLLSDVKRFVLYRDARNQTSHTYDETAADEVINVVPEFFKDASALLQELLKRNS